ncbi:MAG TPA: FUSC family protein [Blastococcus sp.]
MGEVAGRAQRVLGQRIAADVLRRVRERGWSATLRAGRLTGATVAAFLVAELVGLHTPPPLIAALTALLVVQATLASTLVNGVQRVLSVVAGVALAVLFVSVVGLTWWSLGALVAVSIVVGQLLRLGPHLVEVPISAMLVLGVGYTAGAQTVGAGRVIETLIGAAVGVLVNVVFPPAVQSRYAGQSVEKFANEIGALLDDAATDLAAGTATADRAERWLEDARRLNRHVPRVDRALTHAEESRRLNLRAWTTPPVVGLREGLDALEHISVSMRTLFRAVYDTVREQRGVRENPQYAEDVRGTAALLCSRMSRVVREFGVLVRAEMETGGGQEREHLAEALDELRRARIEAHDLLIEDPRSRQGLWELNSTLLTIVDRMLDELDVAVHARRQDGRTWASGRQRAHQAAERLRASLRRIDPHRAAPSPPPGDG